MTSGPRTVPAARSTPRRRAADLPVTVAVGVALGTTLVFALALVCWPLLLPREQLRVSTAGWGLWGLDATRVLVPAVLLTALGWWSTAGFTRRVTWAGVWPFLPLLLLVVLNLFSGNGNWATEPGTLAVATITMLAVGFGEEATFRGVVLRSLEVIGPMRAAVVSSVLFGAFHLVNLVLGSDPVDVAFQVLYTALIGFAFAAPALVTGAIWPLVLVHAAMDLANAVQASAPLAVAASAPGPGMTDRVVTAVPNALLAAYGYWLLRRHLARDGGGTGRRRAGVTG